MESVIIEMNECFVVEIFSEALGSEAVICGDFLVVCREREAPSVLEVERIVSLSFHSRELIYYTTLLS